MKTKRSLIIVLLVLLLAALVVPTVIGAPVTFGDSQPEPIGTPVDYCGCGALTNADVDCPDDIQVYIC